MVAVATYGVLCLRSAPWGFFAAFLLRLLLVLGGVLVFLLFSVPIYFDFRSICFLYFQIYLLSGSTTPSPR